MTVKVISGEVIHNGERVKIGGVVKGISKEDAERLCKCGLCEMLGDAEEIDETKDLDEMTKPELIAYAESIGVEVDNKDTKAKIIEKITLADMPETDIPQE
jgi:hypothetical protein